MDPELTFITIHDLTEDARVVYASTSIQYVLGYTPDDVKGKKLFDYFHPEEIPLAKSIHGRGVHLDKAAVLAYCRIKTKDGDYVTCECIFSVVYDVFVAATSIYRQTQKSRGRALTAPVIRRVFSSSHHDPRYSMLTHLSSKFRTTPPEQHEPRAALILNRFTRSLTVMYSSIAVTNITGFPANDIEGRSFYEFIEENCLQNAVEAFERAKENDSIAYLRFRWRTPSTRRNSSATPALPPPPSAAEAPSAGCNKGKRKRGCDEEEEEDSAQDTTTAGSSQRKRRRNAADGEVMDAEVTALGEPDELQDGLTVAAEAEAEAEAVDGVTPGRLHEREVEVEAVVSCTSDGLVVVLRRARPLIPKPFHGTKGPLFTSPWARNPLLPARPAEVLEPEQQQQQEDKLSQSDFMESIRQVAVFAWSLHSLGGEAVASRKRRSSNDRGKALERRRALRGSSCPPALGTENTDADD